MLPRQEMRADSFMRRAVAAVVLYLNCYQETSRLEPLGWYPRAIIHLMGGYYIMS
jgi:hypothetical protein